MTVVYIFFLAVWNASLFVFLSFITNLDLFPLLVLFVCSYSKGINKTFKRICHWILWMLVPSLILLQEMDSRMRGTKVNRVSNRKMCRLHCVLSQWWSSSLTEDTVIVWPIFSLQTSHQFNTDQKVSGFANRVNFFSWYDNHDCTPYILCHLSYKEFSETIREGNYQ